jgi:hypothetical protein
MPSRIARFAPAEQSRGVVARPITGSYMLGNGAAVTGHAEVDMWRRTLTGYLVGVLVVLAILNAIYSWHGAPRAHDVAIFSVGFLLGAFGMYLAACLYGYRRTA